jgi:hypothetical protein
MMGRNVKRWIPVIAGLIASIDAMGGGFQHRQAPDLSNNALDFGALIVDPVAIKIILADDFRCTSSGPVTNIVILGSWFYDTLPEKQPALTVSIWSHNPGAGGTPPSPGTELWSGTTSKVRVYSSGPNRAWWQYVATPPFAGTQAGLYEYTLTAGRTTGLFLDANTTYWLSLAVDLKPGPESFPQLGWRTTTTNAATAPCGRISPACGTGRRWTT